jgi:hypothetical protein
MKISHLIDYLHKLDTISVPDMQLAHQLQMQDLYVTACYHPEISWESFTQRIQDEKDRFDSVYQDLGQIIHDLRAAVQREIQDQQQTYYQSCINRWENSERQNQQIETAIDRKLELDPKKINSIRSLILKYQDWRWPGLILRPGRENFINDMVSLDPLYLVDTKQELLQPALGRFNPVYQNRLCCYEVNENSSPLLGMLPQAQFGLVFAYHFFEFRPMGLLDRWLQDIWELLRPGGQFVFTYNDCDTLGGISRFDRGLMSYTPGARIMLQAQTIGFDILDQHIDEDVSWMVLSRPGNKISLRGSQTLAKVVVESK